MKRVILVAIVLFIILSQSYSQLPSRSKGNHGLLSDFSGRQLYKKDVSLFTGNNAFQINDASGLSKGTTYHYCIIATNTEFKVIR